MIYSIRSKKNFQIGKGVVSNIHKTYQSRNSHFFQGTVQDCQGKKQKRCVNII